MDLSWTDSSMDERDIKKEQKELAKLKKFLITEQGTQKVSEYDKELKELEAALIDKNPKKPPPPATSQYNYPPKKNPNPDRPNLGGINFEKLLPSNRRKKLDEDINWNHIERNKRYQLNQKRLEPFRVSPEVTLGRKAQRKLLKAQSKQDPPPAVPASSASSLSLYKSPLIPTQIPPNKPFPKDRKLHLPPEPSSSLKDYKTSLRIYLK